MPDVVMLATRFRSGTGQGSLRAGRNRRSGIPQSSPAVFPNASESCLCKANAVLGNRDETILFACNLKL